VRFYCTEVILMIMKTCIKTHQCIQHHAWLNLE